MPPQPEGLDPDAVRYIFGAGFVFGVVSTTLILVVVLAVATGSSAVDLLVQPLVLGVGTAMLLAMIVGSALFLLAFPENRVRVPVVRGDLTDDRG